MLPQCLTPFQPHSTPDHLSKHFFSLFSLLFFFFSLFYPLSQPGLYSLLLLVCLPHPLKVIFHYCRHVIYSFCFGTIFLFPSIFIKLHLVVIAIDPAVGFLQFCSCWPSPFSILLQTSILTLFFQSSFHILLTL